MKSKEPVGQKPSLEILKASVTLENYDQRMAWHGKEIKKWKDNWPFLSHAVEEHRPTADEAAWDRYFLNHLGGYPKSYQLFKRGRIRFYNVPEARPELFDTSYEP